MLLKNEDAGSIQSFLLFLVFQELSTVTEVMEEIFEVNTNLCDFTQDTPKTQAPPKNHRLHPPY